MASASPLQFNLIPSQHRFCNTGVESRVELGFSYGQLKFNRRRNCGHLLISSSCSGTDNAGPTDRGGDDEPVLDTEVVVEVANKDSFSLKESFSKFTESVVAKRDSLNLKESVSKFTEFFVAKKVSLNPKESYSKFREAIAVSPPAVFLMKRQPGTNFLLGIGVATACLIVAVRMYMARKSRRRNPGTMADLVRRGQVRSDRRGISKPLKYEDPFNNPMVKVGKGNSTVEMCGKVYRLAPITLTDEQRTSHQKRRSRAYEWKRPKVFLKEGDSIPPDVDPDTIRWIPANHPFATIASEIDEDMAQTNVYQKHGVPFRIRAEHEELQKKLETLQNQQKLDKLRIDSGNARDFERAFKTPPKPHEHPEPNHQNGQVGNLKPPQSDQPPDSLGAASGN